MFPANQTSWLIFRDLSQIRNQLPRVVRKVQTVCDKLADKQSQENAANEQAWLK